MSLIVRAGVILTDTVATAEAWHPVIGLVAVAVYMVVVIGATIAEWQSDGVQLTGAGDQVTGVTAVNKVFAVNTAEVPEQIVVKVGVTVMVGDVKTLMVVWFVQVDTELLVAVNT